MEVQDQIGCDSEWVGIVEDVPSYDRVIRTRWFLMSLQTQSVLWFCKSKKLWYTHTNI